jgi:hypothetical protein
LNAARRRRPAGAVQFNLMTLPDPRFQKNMLDVCVPNVSGPLARTSSRLVWTKKVYRDLLARK